MWVYRDPINTAPQIVQSIYLSGRPETCSLTFEFDPADMINEGEGWIYRTSTLSHKTAIDVLERHFGTPIDTWGNVTRTGRLDVGRVDQDSYDRDEEIFRDSFHLEGFSTGLNYSTFVWKTSDICQKYPQTS